MTGANTAGLRTISSYCVAHALVDATCAALIFSASAAGRLPVSLALGAVLSYNLLAFAMQPVLGWFVNDALSGRVWARWGALITVLAYAVGWLPAGIWPAVVLAGVGNAAFHVGGGVMSLRVEPGKATMPGLFVAPGAAGLTAGIWMGAHQWFAWAPAVALLLIIPLLGKLAAESGRPMSRTAPSPMVLSAVLPIAAMGTLLVVIAMRAFVGSGLVLPWKSETALLVSLTAAVVIGKAAGGILADRFGRIAVGVGALCLSAPFMVFAPTWAAVGITGMLLFNMTMPVTLVAVADLIPERPGFAFGLTCLALITGSMPVTLNLARDIAPLAVALLVVGSAALLWWGLSARGAGAHSFDRTQVNVPEEA